MVGLFGMVYWYGIYFLHARVFAGMLRGIANASREARQGGGPVVVGRAAG